MIESRSLRCDSDSHSVFGLGKRQHMRSVRWFETTYLLFKSYTPCCVKGCIIFHGAPGKEACSVDESKGFYKCPRLIGTGERQNEKILVRWVETTYLLSENSMPCRAKGRTILSGTPGEEIRLGVLNELRCKCFSCWDNGGRSRESYSALSWTR